MLTQAEDIIAEKQLDAKAIFTDSEHILSILRSERARGALVAVARGNHAHLIKENSDIPLSEIVITGQELALLISKAKAQLDNPDDVIALIGFYSMFSDVKPIAKVLQANVKVYYATSSKTVDSMVQQAHDEGAGLVIGGEKAIRYAKSLGMRTLFLNPTRDSINAAVVAARRICYGIEAEQKKTAEFMSLMDYTFDAIIRLDRDGVIAVANANAELAFHMPANKMVGRFIFDLLEAGEESLIKRAVYERREVHATILKVSGKEYIANLAMLGRGESFEGFILSMQSFSRAETADLSGGADVIVGASQASRRLEEYTYPSKAMRQLRGDAANVAQYDLPVLITGRFGTDKARLAECIHNASPRADKPFVRLDLASIPAQMQQHQMSVVSGTRLQKTVFESALSGTVLIENIELLTAQMQPFLTYICKHGWVLDANMQPAFPVNCRIIATTNVALNEETMRGRFSPALYHELSRIALYVPGLMERREDIDALIDEKLSALNKTYQRAVSIETFERNQIAGSYWQSDELELTQFIEKLVLFAVDQDIDEELLTRLKRYTNMNEPSQEAEKPSVPQGEEAELIGLIERYRGNREQIASAMGISKTTLWRKLKKYGLIRQ
ncbi:MAG: PrpR N-terminal domain-containing protein [Clostridia bacterium]|nr:PrpR N-terminal domain-containing protein [Clostridia bacterium]